MKLFSKILITTSLIVSFFIFITSVISTTSSTSDAQTKELPKSYSQTMKLSDPLPANIFVELSKLANPAVVNISTSTVPKFGNRGYSRDPFLEMLERFYGGGMMPKPRPQQSLGTGFIIRDDGLIVTNNHVIAGADVITVQLDGENSKSYEAKKIGSDERSDIALIKIEAPKKLPYLVLGSSQDLQVGEWVAAFGNPYGYGHTVTKGIVSAKLREIDEINKFPLIQTDASINPGNSGGPLINIKGEVVGVNSAIDARAQGIGFAIPIDEVKKIIPLLEKEGHLKRGYIGVMLGNLDPRYAKSFGLEPGEGVVITNVEKGGPAEKAGLQPYDIVTEVNGKKISSDRDMMNAIGDSDIGTSTKIKVIREGKTLTLNVKIATRPEQVKFKPKIDAKNFKAEKDKMKVGLSLIDMNPQIREQYEILEEFGNKPVVTQVEGGSIAQLAGIRPGDVVIDVNKKDVVSAKEALAALKKGQNTIRLARGQAVVITMFEIE